MNTKLFVPVFILILLAVSVWGQVSSDVSIMNSINERLERNKAEIIKVVRDSQTANQNATQTFIDSNFEVLDGRIQDFLKAAKRDMAVIMVATFVIGFVLSQIIRLSIEKSRQQKLIKRAMELEIIVAKLEKDASGLVGRVEQLKKLDAQYSTELKSMTKKPPFITIWGIIIAIVAFLLGIGIMLVQVKPGG